MRFGNEADPHSMMACEHEAATGRTSNRRTFGRALSTLLRAGMVALLGAVAMPGGAAFAADEKNWEDHPYIIKDGKVDYGVYNGFRRYHSSCHGPDGLGSTYAPALKDSLKTMS
ncbi:hypothetical protein [Breoghania sp.]|uniref:hypothetical protein n=1 Tax=Breoghania sp. TaxID=2065378 RepID=UPI00261DD53E|nr:hypothetical protein [Breoghania sp.]MDJ0931743.1 hypothetical protein [Breoghania sp.]